MTLKLAERVATSQTWLDSLSDRVQPVVREAVAGTGRRGADLLDGVWLGAPLHPALTDVPVGALTAAVALDSVAVVTGSGTVDRQADGALAVSVAGAVAAAATGLSDWRYMRGEKRRLAAAHGLLNVVGLAFNATSLGLRLGVGAAPAGSARRWDSPWPERPLTWAANSALAWGCGSTRHRPGPVRLNSRRCSTSHSSTARRCTGWKSRVKPCSSPAQRAAILCAIANTCSHFGGPLDQGEREGDVVVCPWHASRFDVCSGEVKGGPAVFPQPRFETRARDGKIEIRRAPS